MAKAKIDAWQMVRQLPVGVATLLNRLVNTALAKPGLQDFGCAMPITEDPHQIFVVQRVNALEAVVHKP